MLVVGIAEIMNNDPWRKVVALCGAVEHGPEPLVGVRGLKNEASVCASVGHPASNHRRNVHAQVSVGFGRGFAGESVDVHCLWLLNPREVGCVPGLSDGSSLNDPV